MATITKYDVSRRVEREGWGIHEKRRRNSLSRTSEILRAAIRILPVHA